VAGCASPTSSAGHPGRGAPTRHALTFQSDHLMGAGQGCSRLLQSVREVGVSREEAEGHTPAPEAPLRLHPAEPLACDRQQAAGADGQVHGRAGALAGQTLAGRGPAALPQEALGVRPRVGRPPIQVLGADRTQPGRHQRGVLPARRDRLDPSAHEVGDPADGLRSIERRDRVPSAKAPGRRHRALRRVTGCLLSKGTSERTSSPKAPASSLASIWPAP